MREFPNALLVMERNVSLEAVQPPAGIAEEVEKCSSSKAL